MIKKSRLKTLSGPLAGVWIMGLLAMSSSCASVDTGVDMSLPVNTPEALEQWCKRRSTQYFAQKNKKIEQWHALWKIEKNIIDIKASLISASVNYTVRCRVEQGATFKKAIIDIAEARPGDKS